MRQEMFAPSLSDDMHVAIVPVLLGVVAYPCVVHVGVART